MITKLIVGRIQRPSGTEIDGYSEAGNAPREQRAFVRRLYDQRVELTLCTLSLIQINELMRAWHADDISWIENTYLRSPFKCRRNATIQLLDVASNLDASWYANFSLVNLLARGHFDAVLDAEDTDDSTSM